MRILEKSTFLELFMHNDALYCFASHSMLHIPLGVIRTISDTALVRPKLQI